MGHWAKQAFQSPFLVCRQDRLCLLSSQSALNLTLCWVGDSPQIAKRCCSVLRDLIPPLFSQHLVQLLPRKKRSGKQDGL